MDILILLITTFIIIFAFILVAYSAIYLSGLLFRFIGYILKSLWQLLLKK